MAEQPAPQAQPPQVQPPEAPPKRWSPGIRAIRLQAGEKAVLQFEHPGGAVHEVLVSEDDLKPRQSAEPGIPLKDLGIALAILEAHDGNNYYFAGSTTEAARHAAYSFVCANFLHKVLPKHEKPATPEDEQGAFYAYLGETRSPGFKGRVALYTTMSLLAFKHVCSHGKVLLTEFGTLRRVHDDGSSCAA